MYDGFINGNEPTITAIKDPVVHGKKRKFLSYAFSTKALKCHETTIDSYCDLFIKQLTKYGSAIPMNMNKWYNWFTFDVIGDLAFGESFKCLELGTTRFSTQLWI